MFGTLRRFVKCIIPFKFFPEHADLSTHEKDRILLRHLLTMTAGLEWDEYLPYTDPMNSEIRMIRWIARMGLGGQLLFVVPDFDLVGIVTAGLYTDPLQYWLPTQLLNRYVLAAVRD